MPAHADSPYIFWGHEVSLYSGKVRAYLRFKGIPFVEKIPGLATVSEEFKLRNGTHLIPVVYTPDGLSVQDTTRIIDFLESRFPAAPIYPQGPVQTFAALLLEAYGDGGLIPHAMHFRWNYFAQNRHVIEPDFGALIDPELDEAERIARSGELADRMRAMLKPLGITEHTQALIEADTHALWQELNAHFEVQDYLFGSRPSIGDYGLFGPHYAHLYRDPYPGALMRETAPALAAWVERMHSTTQAAGNFDPDDQIAPTLHPILKRCFNNFVPLALETLDAIERFRQASQGKPLPRFLPRTQASTVGVAAPAALIPDQMWKIQRALQFYQQLPAPQRASVEKLLRQVGGLEAMQFEQPHPLHLNAGRLGWDLAASLPLRYS